MTVQMPKANRKKAQLSISLLFILFCMGSVAGFIFEGLWSLFRHGQ